MTRHGVHAGYAAMAVGFLVLAGLRAAQGAPVWAVVFVVAALANGWLAVRAAEPDVAQAPAPSRERLLRSLEHRRTSARHWQLFGIAGIVLGGGLLLVEPDLAILAGLAALFCVFQARRARHDSRILRRLAGQVSAKP